MTRQRALILDIMREKSPQHLTADELFKEARLRMPHIARGCVMAAAIWQTCPSWA